MLLGPVEIYLRRVVDQTDDPALLVDRHYSSTDRDHIFNIRLPLLIKLGFASLGGKCVLKLYRDQRLASIFPSVSCSSIPTIASLYA